MRTRPARAGTQRALRLIGPARTKLLLFTGRRLEGEQAVAWGLAELLADDPVQARNAPPCSSKRAAALTNTPWHACV